MLNLKDFKELRYVVLNLMITNFLNNFNLRIQVDVIKFKKKTEYCSLKL